MCRYSRDVTYVWLAGLAGGRVRAESIALGRRARGGAGGSGARA